MTLSTTASRLPARERILRAADELFYEHGIRGVGIDRLIAESGVAKATMYSHFASKDDLAAEYVRRRDRQWTAMLRDAAHAAGPDPLDQLLGMFDAIRCAYDLDGYHGCALVHALLDSDPGTGPHTAALAHKQAIRTWMRDLATAAGINQPDTLAYQLSALLDGALVAARLANDPAMPTAATAAAAALIHTATTTNT